MDGPRSRNNRAGNSAVEESAKSEGNRRLANSPGRRASTERVGQRAPSVQKAVALLEELATGPPRATLADFARRVNLPKSSMLAICNTLVDARLMVRATDGTFGLGPRLLELSRAYLSQTNLHTEFERLCREFAVIPEETLVLSVLDGTDVVYIGLRKGSGSVGVSYDLGMRLPANCTASGKALLSLLPVEEIKALYHETLTEPLPSLTPKSITDFPKLLRELEKGRARGYTIDDEETAPGMVCVGAPVLDQTGRPVAALAASMVKAALKPRTEGDVAMELKRLTGALSQALGGIRDPF